MLYIPKKLPCRYIVPFSYIQHMLAYKGNQLTTQEILYNMDYENNQYNRKWLNQAIISMIGMKVLNGSLLEQNKYEFKREKVDLKSKEYYSCEFSELKQIMQLKEKCNRIDLAGYYAILSSTINYKTKVGNSFISTLCDMTGLNKVTVVKYNKLLEDNKLIYMIHSSTKGKPNYYGKIDDFDRVVKAAYKAGLYIPKETFDLFIKYKQLY